MPGMIDQVLESDRDARQQASAGPGVDQVGPTQRTLGVEFGEGV